MGNAASVQNNHVRKNDMQRASSLGTKINPRPSHKTTINQTLETIPVALLQEESLSSLSDDEEEEIPDDLDIDSPESELKQPEEEIDNCQRRLYYIQVPIGTSGQLTKRVFETKLRHVDICPLENQICTSTPSLFHSTTNTVIVRWELPSVADMNRITHQEVQWKQPPIDGEMPRRNAWAELTNDPDLQQMEVFCDDRFCTLPSEVIKVIDLRAEVKLSGLNDCESPLFFRVRTKSGHYGWSQWSEVSTPILPLPSLCADMLPYSPLLSSHSISLGWNPPSFKKYGKISCYRLQGCMITPNEQLMSAKKSTNCQWITLYEGTDTEHAICGESAISLLISAMQSKGHNFHVLGLNAGLLPAEWPFMFRLEADAGTWFHGQFHPNYIKSPIARVTTLPPLLDSPPFPELINFHGSATSTSVTIRLQPPKTYGGGHDLHALVVMYPFENTVDWFGVSVVEEKVRSWSEMNEKYKQFQVVENDNLAKEGWSLVPGEAAMWSNSLTGEVKWHCPTSE